MNKNATAVLVSISLLAFAGCGGGEPQRPRRAATPLDLSTVGAIEAEVLYEGAPPPADTISMRTAPACAALHQKPVVDPVVNVSDGHLLNAVVYIKQGLGERVFEAPAAPAVFDQKGCIYVPRVVGAMVGQPVEFRNSDPEAHNVRGRPRVLDSWNFMMSRQGSTKTLTFEKAELGVSVGCDIHPWMQAYLSVFEHPYFAVTAGAGKVTLSNVPPGDYVIGAWHEKLGTREQKVTLAAQGTQAVQFRFGK